MAETIKIFELDVDVDAAIKATSDLKKKSIDLKESLDALKKSGDTSSETYVRLEAAYKNVNREYSASQTQIGKLLKLQGQQIKTVEQGRNALTILNKEWAKAASLYGENSKEADELAKKHLELKNRVNELQKSVGDTSGNIGNYTDSIVEAAGKTSLFGRAQSAVKDILGIVTPVFKVVRTEVKGIYGDYVAATAGTKGYTTAQKAAAIGTNLVSAALKLLKIALISTGIGAIVVLIGSLVAWFSKTQVGIDFVNKALAALGAAFDVIIDRAAKLGGALVKFFTGDFSGAFKDIEDAVSGLGDEMLREIDLAFKLEKALQDLTKQETLLDFRRAAANTRIKELNKLVEDTTKTTEDRIAAAKEVERIETSIAEQELANANQALTLAQGKLAKDEESIQLLEKLKAGTISYDEVLKRLGLSESTQEDLEKFLETFKKAEEAQQRSFEVRTTNQNKLNTLLNEEKRKREQAAKEAEAASKKAIDDAIKENQTRLKLFSEQNRNQAKTLSDSIKFQEEVRDKRLAILNQEVEAGKKTQTEAELERLKIKNEFLEKETELTIQYAQSELEIFKQSNKSRLEQGQLLTDAMVAQETARLEAIAEKEREFQAKRLEEGVISEQEYNDAIDQVNEEYRSSRKELDLELKEQKAEADAIDFENEQALRIERDGLIFEAKLAELEKIKQAEIEAAQKVGADTTKIDQKFALLRAQIKQQETNHKLTLQKELFGGISQLLGQETIAGKAAGIAAATINTYQGVSEVWRAKSTLPEPFGTAAKVVSTGVVLGSGLAAVKKIASTKVDVPKAAKGITLKGPSHSQGGIDLFDAYGNPMVNAEGDENIYVLNRRASALINGLSSINELTGGIPLSTPTNFAADGGLIQRSIQANTGGSPIVFKNESIDYDLMAMKIGEANQLLPRPITDVQDIIGQVNNYNQVVSGANI